MNLSTFVGLFAGAFFIVVSILIGGDLSGYYDLPSVMIVLGGTAAATMVSYSFDDIKRLLANLKNAFYKPKIHFARDIENIIRLANIARREGLLALDGEEYDDPFLQKGIELIVDGTDGELVKDIMESEIGNIEAEEAVSPTILASMSQYGPAFGMVGTLVGLINMLANMSDASTLGPQMSTALITTFYGVILANMIFLPMTAKLRVSGALRVSRYELLLEGILSIQNGENPRIIREKLNALVMDKSMLKEEPEEESEKEAGSEGSMNYGQEKATE